jgi:mannan endo-1,4-beta-mannosidase
MNRVLIIVFFFSLAACNQKGFVSKDSTKFRLQGQDYSYIGCNYWYGAYIGATDPERLKKELDFLVNNKVNNLRVFICGEGDSSYVYRVSPSLQEKPRQYNEQLLQGFDYLLVEAFKRNLKIVFVLNNNWEWSGGFGQYLQWSGKENPPLPKTERWDWNNYCKYISTFYSCDSCLAWNNAWIEKVINRTNTLSGIDYKNDPSIMAWELANEPRPMDSSAIDSYKKWIHETAGLIKSFDKNHLITIGTEGVISTFYSEEIYRDIHSDKNIDYCTLHLWPKTWQWYNGESNASVSDTTLEKTKRYIEQHARLCKEIRKPLVIEEFGLHRDENSFSPKATTKNRDTYYKFIFETGKNNNIAGYNFWGALGLYENVNNHGFMKKGMAFSADPPQEEQGLYSVFVSDSSTWKTISNNILQLSNKVH